MIKHVYQHTGGNVGDGWAISMALSLYSTLSTYS